MNVRAKFECTHKTSHISNVQDESGGGWVKREVGTVKLTPVFGDENKMWSVWTPCGSIEMTINNPDAFAAFKLGQAYFVDFTPAAPASAE